MQTYKLFSTEKKEREKVKVNLFKIAFYFDETKRNGERANVLFGFSRFFLGWKGINKEEMVFCVCVNI